MLTAGDRVDRYIVESPLARGGMARVYIVRHEVLGTRHALKVLSSTHSGLLARMVREGQLQASLDPAHIVPVTDVFEVDGSLALLMPLVQGCSLADLLAAYRPSEAEAGALFAQISRGVGVAHAQGVVHRDLKPHNVLLALESGAVRARVSDFGIAKREGDERETRGFVGTPAYAAPEQLLHAASADGRADLWSLGVILYELLTAKRPFAGFDPVALFSSTYEEDPLPDGWRAVIRGLLQPDPDARTPSVADLLRQIAHHALPIAAEALGEGSGVARVVGEHKASLSKDSAPPAELATMPRAAPSPARPWLQPSPQLSRPQEQPKPRHNLSPDRDLFVGRQSELASLDGLFNEGSRLVTVMGPAGVGKTRLAEQFARRWSGTLPGGTWLCPLSEARSPDALAAAVGALIEAPLGKGDPVAQIGYALAARGRALILLDNFEQLAPFAQETLGRWLDLAPDALLLVTSRQLLGIAGERVFLLDPLPVDASIELFAERAKAARHGFTIAEEEREIVRSLVQRLDGLPLAIELAAARVRVMSIESIHARLEDRFRLLSSASRRDRHTALRAALDSSWDLLSETERAALAQLSVFEGGLSIDALEDVLDLSSFEGDPWSIDAATALVERSLVRAVAPDRLSLLASIQSYARERLEELGQVQAIEARHGDYFARLGTREAVRSMSKRVGTSLRETAARDLDNLVVACQRAALSGRGEVAVATLCAASEILSWRGLLDNGAALAKTVLEMPSLPDPLRGRAEETAAGLSQQQGRFAEAAERCERAEAAYLAAGDAAAAAHVRAARANLLRLLGRLDEARVLLDASIGVVRDHKDRDSEGSIHSCYALIALQKSDLQESRVHFDLALAIARETGNQRAEGNLLNNLGLLYSALSDLEAARTSYEASLAVHREIGDRRAEGSVIINLASLLLRLGRPEEAKARNEETLGIQRAIGDRRSEGIVFGNLGNIYRERGEIDKAREYYEAALKIHREVGNRPSEGVTLANLGSIHRELGDIDASLACYERSLALAQESGDRRVEAMALGNIGILHRARGRNDLALEHYEAALSSARESRDRRHEGFLVGLIANLRYDHGDLDSALALYGESLACARETGDQRQQGIYLRNLATIKREMGHFVEARAHLDESERLTREISDRLELGKSLAERVQLEIAAGDLREAAQQLRRAEEIAEQLRAGAGTELARYISSARHALEQRALDRW